jgi:hypothetical protein
MGGATDAEGVPHPGPYQRIGDEVGDSHITLLDRARVVP